jgi:long-subunit acyl-CoA synthetase (AMP-forming)
MKFLNSALEMIKKYWYLFLILLLTGLVLVVGFVENSKMAGLVNAVKDIIENYKKQVKTVDKLASKKSSKDKKVIQTYEERAKQIQEKRDTDLSKVNAKKLEVVQELKDKSTDELAQKLKEEFKL